jgi:hypothetical protein
MSGFLQENCELGNRNCSQIYAVGDFLVVFGNEAEESFYIFTDPVGRDDNVLCDVHAFAAAGVVNGFGFGRIDNGNQRLVGLLGVSYAGIVFPVKGDCSGAYGRCRGSGSRCQ